jgi:hypothetical protein
MALFAKVSKCRRKKRKITTSLKGIPNKFRRFLEVLQNVLRWCINQVHRLVVYMLEKKGCVSSGFTLGPACLAIVNGSTDEQDGARGALEIQTQALSGGQIQNSIIHTHLHGKLKQVRSLHGNIKQVSDLTCGK